MMPVVKYYEGEASDESPKVLVNSLRASSMENQAELVKKVLTSWGYEPIDTNFVNVFDVRKPDVGGVLWMQLFAIDFLTSQIPAYREAKIPKAMYVTIEGVPHRSAVIHSSLTGAEYVAVSDFVAKMLMRVGVRVKAAVHHAIDMDLARKAVDLSDRVRKLFEERFKGKVTITLVARNDPRKGFDALAEALRILRGKGVKDFVLVVKSDPSAKDVLKGENVFFTNWFGSTTYLETLALMAGSDYTVFPTYCEGFGLPVLESMAVGTPVIHTWCPPLTEFSSTEFNFVYEFDDLKLVQNIHRQYWVFHVYNPEYLAEMIELAIDTKLNNLETYEDYCAKAMEHASKWDYRSVYPNLLRIMGLKNRS